MGRTVIRGGRVVDPILNIDGVADVLIEDGLVRAVGTFTAPSRAETVDAFGLVVTPGLVDVHVHLREPGFPQKETIASGTAAAAAGGFTTVFCMPNTEPALDGPEVLRELGGLIDRDAMVNVHPIAAISKGRLGEEATDYDALVAAGAVGFSDDGVSTTSSAVLALALEASRRHRRPVMVHCEEPTLAIGSMHAGAVSERLGRPGTPAVAETLIIARDLELAATTGGWLHLCHVSIGDGADLLRRAKRRGVRATGEAMPHHLVMTDEWVAGSRRLVNVDEPEGTVAAAADPNTKVNPPLRPASETRRLLAALRDGTIDLVATDHAPHALADKHDVDFDRAALGFSGLEFALPLMLGLVRAGHLSLPDLVALMSAVPARLWGLPAGTLRPGTPADVVVFDPEERWTVSDSALRGKGVNTPLLGMQLRGRVKRTFVGGEERRVA